MGQIWAVQRVPQKLSSTLCASLASLVVPGDFPEATPPPHLLCRLCHRGPACGGPDRGGGAVPVAAVPGPMVGTPGGGGHAAVRRGADLQVPAAAATDRRGVRLPARRMWTNGHHCKESTIVCVYFKHFEGLVVGWRSDPPPNPRVTAPNSPPRPGS